MVYLINILQAALAPADLSQSYWRKFVGKTESFQRTTFCAFALWGRWNWSIMAQFHQHSTSNFYTSSFMPILVMHSVEHKHVGRKTWAYFLVVRTSKVGHIFVGETERHQPGTPALCVIRIMRLTHKVRNSKPQKRIPIAREADCTLHKSFDGLS